MKGKTFDSWEDYDRALNDYKGNSRFKFRRRDKRKDRARAVCRGWADNDPDSCRAEISACRLKKTGIITIQKVYLLHTCGSSIHAFRNGSNKVAWVSEKLLPTVRINPGISIKDLAQTMRTVHKSKTTYSTAQKARLTCREKISGTSKESFAKIPSYIAALHDIDPDGHFHLQTDDEN